MIQQEPPSGQQENQAQYRVSEDSPQWLTSFYAHTAEEIAEINRLYGWEKYRLRSEPAVESI